MSHFKHATSAVLVVMSAPETFIVVTPMVRVDVQTHTAFKHVFLMCMLHYFLSKPCENIQEMWVSRHLVLPAASQEQQITWPILAYHGVRNSSSGAVTIPWTSAQSILARSVSWCFGGTCWTKGTVFIFANLTTGVQAIKKKRLYP